VILGKNVTFNCSADGHPAPEIKWSYSSGVNVTETTKGRQKSISVTRATSTDAGDYICDATNKVGAVRRTVTLVVQGIITDYVQNTREHIYSKVLMEPYINNTDMYGTEKGL